MASENNTQKAVERPDIDALSASGEVPPDLIAYIRQIEDAHSRLHACLEEFGAITDANVRVRPGGTSIVVRSKLVPIMAAYLAEEFKEAGGVNFVEFTCVDSDIGPLVLTMQRLEGRTPAQLLAEEKLHVVELQERLAYLEGKLNAAEANRKCRRRAKYTRSDAQ